MSPPASALVLRWNADDATLRFEGFAQPVIDLDRHLQAAFDIVNHGPSGRPNLNGALLAMLLVAKVDS